jgi:hypothetical protein
MEEHNGSVEDMSYETLLRELAYAAKDVMKSVDYYQYVEKLHELERNTCDYTEMMIPLWGNLDRVLRKVAEVPNLFNTPLFEDK